MSAALPSSFVAGAELLRLYDDPAAASRLATTRRIDCFGRTVRLTHASPLSREALAFRQDPTSGTFQPLDAWPTPAEATASSQVWLGLTNHDRSAYVRWLLAVAEAEPASLATVGAFTREPAGLLGLWATACARLALPAAVHIGVRHDLADLGIAQLLLGFGADAWSGPIATNRSLPLAGVSRPTETTRTGLATLVRQAGFEPVFDQDDPP